MQASDLKLNVEFFADESGNIVEPDSMNRTKLTRNGKDFWPLPFSQASLSDIQAGDSIEIVIPSGTLTCGVDALNGNKLTCTATWSGIWAGFEGGVCGAGTWSLRVRTGQEEVITSICPTLRTLDDYLLVRQMTDPLPTYGKPKKKQALMEIAWKMIQELRAIAGWGEVLQYDSRNWFVWVPENVSVDMEKYLSELTEANISLEAENGGRLHRIICGDRQALDVAVEKFQF